MTSGSSSNSAGKMTPGAGKVSAFFGVVQNRVTPGFKPRLFSGGGGRPSPASAAPFRWWGEEDLPHTGRTLLFAGRPLPFPAPDGRRAPSAPIPVTLKHVSLIHALFLKTSAPPPDVQSELKRGACMSSDSFQSLFRPEVIWVLIPITAIIATFWTNAVKVRSANALKQSMVERGMSAEEIERVLKA